MDNFYTILNCSEDASYEQIKQSYKTLVKQYHPDKNGENNLNTSDMFQKIDQAWKTLRETTLRKEYDAKLMNEKLEDNLLIYATLKLDELNYSEEQNTYSYNCRCGGIYIVHLNFMDENACIVNCDECSYVIKVIK